MIGIQESEQDDFLISTDKQKLDLAWIHRFLSKESYWAMHIPLDTVQRSIDNSLCIGIYHYGRQIGFARLITDFATFGYLADVVVDSDYRSKGLSKRIMAFVMSLDFVNDLRRLVLGTRDAHGLYAQFGFRPMLYPERFMELHRPDIYADPTQIA